MSKQITSIEMVTQIAVAKPFSDTEKTLVLHRAAPRSAEPDTSERPAYPGTHEIGQLFWATFVIVFIFAFAIAGTGVFLAGMAVYGVIVIVQMIRDVPRKSGPKQPLDGFDALLKAILVPLSLSAAALAFALVVALVKFAS